ncbi:hypothetical protein CBR_g9209 [Chara braunii]|uniref:DUF4360 domain-containing protein n=1 Tax=Chara braunii TaxID=69332 RepID=A0A388KP09_CHABU|nr:hypothetical protein CBR_g9209 [Chara braunii]|eukprot:GBG71800.1 hypothetical protein CBR_g9209 [Chara braunii]
MKKPVTSLFTSPSRATACLLFLILVHFAVNGEARRQPRVRVIGFSYSGSACPPGSMNGTVGGGGFFIGEVRASATGGLLNRRKVCSLSFELSYPSGWQFAVRRINIRGSAKLSSGARGTAQVRYYVSGFPGTASTSCALVGPFRGKYNLPRKFQNKVFSPCGKVRNLNVMVEARITPGTKPQKSDYVSIGGSPFTLGLHWKRC